MNKCPECGSNTETLVNSLFLRCSNKECVLHSAIKYARRSDKTFNHYPTQQQQWINAKAIPPTEFPVWFTDRYGIAIEKAYSLQYLIDMDGTQYLPDSAIPRLPE